jgi:hypothetical protein
MEHTRARKRPEEQGREKQGMSSRAMSSVSKSLYALVVLAAVALPASAKSPIYRCVKDGQTVLTDNPCEDTVQAPPSGANVAPASDVVGKPVSASTSIVGEWHGQTQFQATEGGQVIEDAHSVVSLGLTFSADGKVSGMSPENGCTFLGLWSPGVTPRLFPLDVTLKGCRFAGLNRRYSGNLVATFAENSAQLSLLAITVPSLGQPMRRYDVGATLRR